MGRTNSLAIETCEPRKQRYQGLTGVRSGEHLMCLCVSQIHNSTVMNAVTDKLDSPARLYSLCCFDRGWIVPEVQLFEAEDDQGALAMARSIRPWMTREIWDRHRLVRVLPPSGL